MNIASTFSRMDYGHRKNSSTVGIDSMQRSSTVTDKGHKVYLKTDDMLYSGGNGTGLSFYLKYAENSTKENPVMIATGVDENGNDFKQTINVNDVDPNNATLVEMRALEAYLNVDKGGGLTSFSQSMSNMGIEQRGNFMSGMQKDVDDQTLLGERQNALFYLNNMRTYYSFIHRL